MKLIVSPLALRAMQPRQMARRDATALLRKLNDFAEASSAQHAWASSLAGHPNQARIRQGDWRATVLIVRNEDAVVVERIEHRSEAYR